ncbi:hypothetical protein GCM10011583_67860 [Streptomyces camponoticapitis]|uniref:Cyclase n=1 Tax=Streptomyces camponoticapitis TaxID=1616125 RepID=A0ABQ2EXF4_9ACTN|nr:TcmI family type II polyketide cyclase [Streptomyces camponoticapitis]GGK26330.1 hypothetical protein GCM10011583_67860 [Streptomyces camponoticapitis]
MRHSTLTVARTDVDPSVDVARLIGDFDATEMPHRTGTRRRRLFAYRGPHFHLRDFDDDNGGRLIEEAKSNSRSIRISDELKPLIDAYDPATRRSPKDAMARRFYNWEAKA